ncbi:MAG: hypothetical protein WCB80_00440, partial [Mycobacterium sp.]
MQTPNDAALQRNCGAARYDSWCRPVAPSSPNGVPPAPPAPPGTAVAEACRNAADVDQPLPPLPS